MVVSVAVVVVVVIVVMVAVVVVIVVVVVEVKTGRIVTMTESLAQFPPISVTIIVILCVPIGTVSSSTEIIASEEFQKPKHIGNQQLRSEIERSLSSRIPINLFSDVSAETLNSFDGC